MLFCLLFDNKQERLTKYSFHFDPDRQIDTVRINMTTETARLREACSFGHPNRSSLSDLKW